MPMRRGKQQSADDDDDGKGTFDDGEAEESKEIV
jgi:hypothetical protein